MKTLAQLLKDAAAAHHIYEEGLAVKPDPDWAQWYADYRNKAGAEQQRTLIQEIRAHLEKWKNDYTVGASYGFVTWLRSRMDK
jgi:hypothetical protein